MTKTDLILAEIAAHHRGVVTTRAALARGITEREMDARRAAGVLIPIYRGVFRHAAVPYSHDVRLQAALLACGDDALLTRRSAAVVHGFSDVRRWKPEVMTPHLDLPRVPGITIVRTRHLRPSERTVVRGFPVTSKGRTALDLCAVLPYDIANEVIA